MAIFDKNSGFSNVIEIDKDDKKDASLSAADFIDTKVKKRAYMDVLGARLAMKMLFEQKIEASNLYSLYTIQSVLEELDLADVYVEGIKIDVRLVFNRTQIFIPKSHFENDLLPDVYLVLELQRDLESAEVLGFFEPKTLDKQNASRDFYFYECDKLNAPEEFKGFLDNYVVERNFDISENNQKAEELLLSLIDREISSEDKLFLLKQLANDLDLREKAVEFENFEVISKQVANSDALLNGQVLEIVGAQKLYEEDELSEKLGEDVVIGELGEDEVKKGPSGGSAVAAGVVAGAVAGAIAGVGAVAASSSIAAGATALSEATALGSAATGLAGAALSAVAAGSGLDVLPEIESSEEDLFTIDEESLELEEDELQELELEPLEKEEDSEAKEESELSTATDLEEEDEEQEEDLSDSLTLPEIGESEDVFGDLGELTPLDELVPVEDSLELKEEPVKEEIVKAEPSEDVINLEDFDFDLLSDDSDEEEKEEEPQAVAELDSEPDLEPDSNTVSFDAIIEKEKEFDAEKIASDDFQELIEEDDELEVEANNETNDENKDELLFEEDDEEGASPVSAENTDDFLSQVDDFLNDDFLAGVELDEEQQKMLEDDSAIVSDDNVQAPSAFNYADIDIQDDDLNVGKTENENLQVLFQGGNIGGEQFAPDDELDLGESTPLTYSKPRNNKKAMIAASLAGVILISVVATTVMKPKNADANLNPNAPAIQAPVDSLAQEGPSELTQEEAQDGIQSDFQNNDLDSPLPTAGKAGGKAAVAQQPRDMNKAVSDIFLSEPVNTSISKVGWEVPEDLAYNDSFRKYLQMAGRNLKLNLQNNLLLATEMAYSNKVVVDLSVGRNGELKSSNISVSSGSKQIDNIVLQSVKETLKYLKVPASEISGDSFAATLIINF